MGYKNTLISTITLIAVGFAAWTTFLSLRSQDMTEADKSLPDAFMEDVHALIMDKQGKPKMKIVTPKLTHYPDKDETSLKTPHLTLYRQSAQPWHITSETAKAYQGTEFIDFAGNVVIHHTADENNPATMINTTTLRVQPHEQLADTHDLITMVQPNIVVKAVGMHADMNKGDINLLSQAKGKYVPT